MVIPLFRPCGAMDLVEMETVLPSEHALLNVYLILLVIIASFALKIKSGFLSSALFFGIA